MKNNITKITIITIISLFILGLIGLSYAYFSTEITGEGKYVILDTANLKLKYTDNTVLSLDNAIPGDFVTKTFTVENIGTKKVSYNIIWNNLINTINNYDLQLDMKCKSYKDYNTSSKTESGECSSFYKAVPYTETSISKDIKRNNEIDIGITHEYTVTITFKNRPYLQNDNLNKSFSGKIDLEEYVDNSVYCTFDGTLTQGAEYVNGQYTYRYMQEGKYPSSGLAWQDITSDGWGVQLTDKESTDAVTSKVCTYINNKPITSMSYMFYDSQATTLDVSNFNTSKVTDMSSMFGNSEATTLDVSNFDTSNVTDMSSMFDICQATTLDVSNFDTSKVTNMGDMFRYSQATTLNLSNFNTSNVTNMSSMFYYSKATTLDVSNFDTSEVTDMGDMFYYSKATTLNLSNFDTSKVTNMYEMFYYSKATTLDVSNFDTSKVTNMMNMFQGSSNLKTIYGSSKFVTTAVTNSTDMFKGATSLVGGAGTKYNSSYVDKTYARIDGGTSNPGYFTSIPEPNSFSSDSWMTIAKAVKSGNISKYNVGNTKTVNLGTYGTHILRIANMSTPSECSTTGFSQTACGFVLEFADIITTHKMNDTQTNVGGWPATSMRTFVNNDIYNSLPSELKNAIIDTTVVSSHGSGDTSNFTSTDKLYLLAPKEIYTDFSDSYDTAKDLTRILDYYKNVGVTNNNYSGAIKKKRTDNYFWWLRAAYYTRDYSTFYNIHHVGAWNSSILASNSNGGVSPAFRLG